MRFRFIEDRRGEYPVTIMCSVLDVSPAGYYGWRARSESRRSVANRTLLDDIKRVHRDRRRMRVVAERTRCECCGAVSGVASLRGADTEWTRRVAALRHTQLMMRLRLIRHVWAICAACGAEYDYDAGAHTFHRVGRSGIADDAAKVTAP